MKRKKCAAPPQASSIAGVPFQPMLLVAALRRIAQGVWGLGTPALGLENQNVRSARDLEGGPYHFWQGDLFTPLTPGVLFDLVVSNPPYIAQSEFAGLAPGLAGLYQINVQVPTSGLVAGDTVYIEFVTDAADVNQIQIPYGQAQ